MRGLNPRGMSGSQVSDWVGPSGAVAIPSRPAAAALRYVGSATPPNVSASLAAGDYTFSAYDSGVQKGDLILAVARVGSSGSNRTHAFSCSGLTFTDLTPSASNTNMHLAVAVSPDTTARQVVMTVGAGTNVNHRGAVFLLRRVDSTDELDASGSGGAYSSSTTPWDCGSLSTGEDAAVAIAVVAGWTTVSLASPLTWTAGWSEVFTTTAATGWAILQKPMLKSGSTGTLTVTPPSSNYSTYHLFSTRMPRT